MEAESHGVPGSAPEVANQDAQRGEQKLVPTEDSALPSQEMRQEVAQGLLDKLPSMWRHVCEAAGSARFLWAHNGTTRDGWVELKDCGHLETQWGEGIWKAVEHHEMLEMTFGTCRHQCYMKPDGIFVVENKFRIKSGSTGYKENAPKTRGWVTTRRIRSPGGAATERKRKQEPSVEVKEPKVKQAKGGSKTPPASPKRTPPASPKIMTPQSSVKRRPAAASK